METLDTLARHLGPRGEVVLRRRRGAGADVEELIVNGVFAMDTTETWTERTLAELALAGPAPRRVLVGGLGLGYTAAELLAADVEHLDVVEIEECLVEWAYAGLTPTLGRGGRATPRVALQAGDVAAVLTGRRTGPGRAVGRDPARRRQRPGLPHPREQRRASTPSPAWRPAYARLTAGGTLAIWCQGPAPDLLGRAAAGSPPPRSRTPSPASGRAGPLAYVIYTVTRAVSRPHAAAEARMWAMTAPAGDGEFRIERDTMGEVRVPAAALYRAQTQRAVENFPISGLPIDPALIAALGLIKGAAAQANAQLGVLDRRAGRRDRQGGRRRGGGRARRRVPDRRVPDRLGHLEQHERQRGDRLAGQRAAGRADPPERRRQRLPVQQRRVPERDPHRRHPEPGQRPGARRCATSSRPWRPRPRSSPRWSRAAGPT